MQDRLAEIPASESLLNARNNPSSWFARRQILDQIGHGGPAVTAHYQRTVDDRMPAPAGQSATFYRMRALTPHLVRFRSSRPVLSTTARWSASEDRDQRGPRASLLGTAVFQPYNHVDGDHEVV
jgi:hypothetical protein